MMATSLDLLDLQTKHRYFGNRQLMAHTQKSRRHERE